MHGHIDVLFIPQESLVDTNKIVTENGGTPLECVTMINGPYEKRTMMQGPSEWMQVLENVGYTWMFYGSANKGHQNVPRDLKGNP